MVEAPRKLRCAIYTRKSTEDGLEQEFNSLDAQYEACRAYILSQRHEGWSLTSERYDDGGFSGGTLERPALKNLLEQRKQGVKMKDLLPRVSQQARQANSIVPNLHLPLILSWNSVHTIKRRKQCSEWMKLSMHCNLFALALTFSWIRWRVI